MFDAFNNDGCTIIVGFLLFILVLGLIAGACALISDLAGMTL